MKRIALLALSASLATPAAGQNRTCRDIRAVVNADGSDFRSVSASMAAGTGVFLAVQGRRIDLPAARSCDLDVDPDDRTSLDCTWETNDSVQAGVLYDRVLARLSPCLATPLTAGTPFAGTARIVQTHNGTFVTRGRRTDLGLTLFENPATGADAPGGPRPVSYTISLSVELDTAQVIPPEEVEEEESDS
jgi:hypothetical protein